MLLALTCLFVCQPWHWLELNNQLMTNTYCLEDIELSLIHKGIMWLMALAIDVIVLKALALGHVYSR